MDVKTDLCARSLLGVVLGSAPQWEMEVGLDRGESQTNALAAEASANPTSFSGAKVALQRCPELRQEDWALGLLHDWLQAASKEVASS